MMVKSILSGLVILVADTKAPPLEIPSIATVPMTYVYAVAAETPSGKAIVIKVDEDGYVIPSQCKN